MISSFCCLVQFLVTPKKMGAQTAEANSNSGIAAAKQVVEFFRDNLVKHQVGVIEDSQDLYRGLSG